MAIQEYVRAGLDDIARFVRDKDSGRLQINREGIVILEIGLFAWTWFEAFAVVQRQNRIISDTLYGPLTLEDTQKKLQVQAEMVRITVMGVASSLLMLGGGIICGLNEQQKPASPIQ